MNEPELVWEVIPPAETPEGRWAARERIGDQETGLAILSAKLEEIHDLLDLRGLEPIPRADPAEHEQWREMPRVMNENADRETPTRTETE